MTDLERVEEAARRVSERLKSGPDAYVFWAFCMFADELLRVSLEKDPVGEERL